MKDDLRKIAIELYNVGAIKHGKFTLKTGLETPIYIDLIVIVNFPELLVSYSPKIPNSNRSEWSDPNLTPSSELFWNSPKMFCFKYGREFSSNKLKKIKEKQI